MGQCLALFCLGEYVPPDHYNENIKERPPRKGDGRNLNQNSDCKNNKNCNNNRYSSVSTDQSEEGKEDVDKLDGNPPPKLPNIGNSCYINSAIQCITATPKIKDSLNSVSNEESKTEGLLAKRFKQILWKKKKGSISSRNFHYLKMLVSKHNERFQEHNQEDVAEFLSSVITGVSIDLEYKLESNKKDEEDTLNSELVNIDEIDTFIEKETVNQSLKECSRIKEIGTSDFIDLFRTQIYSEIKCKGGCKSMEMCFEDRIILEFDLPKKINNPKLIDCFYKTFKKVNYGKVNDNYCGECKAVTKFSRKEWISKLPKIMIIHLKRFETIKGEQQRNNKSIEFPIENLDTFPLVHPYFKKYNQNFMYNLYGISIHTGTLSGGHYTANIKNITGDKKWYECDDSIIKEIDKPINSGSGPYVLFYHRIDVVNQEENL